jgi:hypothetical protein
LSAGLRHPRAGSGKFQKPGKATFYQSLRDYIATRSFEILRAIFWNVLMSAFSLDATKACSGDDAHDCNNDNPVDEIAVPNATV